MAESKYGKYIVTQPLDIPKDVEDEAERRHAESLVSIAYADGKTIKGASLSTGAFWHLPFDGVSDSVIKEAHTHPFDEVLTYFGSNPDDPHDLGGELEMWLEDEKFVMTKSFIIYIPAGMKHCPLILKRVERPIFHYVVANTGTNLTLF